MQSSSTLNRDGLEALNIGNDTRVLGQDYSGLLKRAGQVKKHINQARIRYQQESMMDGLKKTRTNDEAIKHHIIVTEQDDNDVQRHLIELGFKKKWTDVLCRSNPRLPRQPDYAYKKMRCY